MTIERVEELRFKGDKEKKSSDLLNLCFQADFGGRSFFQNRHHCRFLYWQDLEQDLELAGHLAIAFRAIQLGNQRVDIVGIGEVAVAPNHRRKGIASQLIAAALDEGELAKADFAVLFGEQNIYTKAGFRPAPNQITLSKMEGAKTGRIVEEVHPYLMVKQLGELPWDDKAPVDLAGFSF